MTSGAFAPFSLLLSILLSSFLLFFPLTGTNLLGDASSAGKIVITGKFSTGNKWFNESGKRERMWVNLEKKSVTIRTELPIYHSFFTGLESSLVKISGFSEFGIIINDRIYTARTKVITSEGIGDSEAFMGFVKGKNMLTFSLLIPSGDSDFYFDKFPTGSGRWGVRLSYERESSLLSRDKFSTSVEVLLPRDYTYIDYLGNYLTYNAPVKKKFFISYSAGIHTGIFTATAGFNYYHEIALSRENLLTVSLCISSPDRRGGITLELPVYGKYYPSEMLPSFFWEREFPAGYELSFYLEI